MKTTFCKCGNRLFFNNYTCLACGRAVGQCGVCHKMSSFSLAPTEPTSVTDSGAIQSESAADSKTYTCDQPGCGQAVVMCINRAQGACTNFVPGPTETLCECCKFTSLIPDLEQPANLNRWIALESAKRRLLAELKQLQLPPYIDDVQSRYPLTFRFPVPTVADGELQPVITGHAEGVITINGEEADSDRREATRVALGEPHRTLIGHMRHEIGHYIDWSYAWPVARDAYIELFGDPIACDYEQAKQRHYAEGAPADWPTRFVSAYASMHPWEDFAETVNAYLDLMAIAETARDQKLCDIDNSFAAEIPRIIQQTLPVAVAISEFNTDLGLQPLLPEQLSPAAVSKLSFVHRLRHPEMQARFKQHLASEKNADANDLKPAPRKPHQPRPTSPAQGLRQPKAADQP